VLADRISTLPLKVYRRTPQGRVPAGDSSRAVQLLSRPSCQIRQWSCSTD
jgi:hypothetical protein